MFVCSANLALRGFEQVPPLANKANPFFRISYLFWMIYMCLLKPCIVGESLSEGFAHIVMIPVSGFLPHRFQ